MNLSKKELLKCLEYKRTELEERYFQNWNAYTYRMSIYIAIDKFSGEIKATDKNNWNYERCIRIKKIGTYKTDMAKTKQDILDKTKEEQFKELYIENDKLYKMAKRAINRYFKNEENVDSDINRNTDELIFGTIIAKEIKVGYEVEGNEGNRMIPQKDLLAELIEYEELENLKKREEDYYKFKLRKQIEEEIKEELNNMTIDEQLDLVFSNKEG